ncbi:HlyD family secretion protein [Acidiphilium sp. PA]|uniref:HlyD family secretion protein n=1 Tax=Acidiphilium sp. PA TaxID=2871705 RepID=UPI0022438F63|nr:HlyD family secretion protein [Acidiphilium sp. PA]MCW8306240.1 HlyD family secretion protein [Acidiphilium sp. PA]
MSQTMAAADRDGNAVAGRRRFRRRVVLLLGLVIVLGGASWYVRRWWTVGRFVASTDDAYVGGDVTPISPHVAGFVGAVLVRDNQYVHAGQPIIALRGHDLRAARARAAAIVRARSAALAQLAADIDYQHAMIASAAADLAAREADAAFAASDAARYRVLARSGANSRQDAQKALAAAQAARAGVAASRAALTAARRQLAVLATRIVQAHAAKAAAVADLRLAQLKVGYTIIRAPIDGYVGNRAAQAGAYVTAGSYLLSIVPARGLWVDANFKEDDLAAIRPGQPVRIVADVLPARVFHGHVESLAPASGAVFSVIPAQNATGNFTKIVQRVPVRIALDGGAATLGRLRPGLSATVSVDTKAAR